MRNPINLLLVSLLVTTIVLVISIAIKLSYLSNNVNKAIADNNITLMHIKDK